MHRRLLFPCTLLFGLALLSGCANKKKKDFPGMSGDYDYVSGTPLPERGGASFFAGNVDRTQFPPIYFGYDSYVIEPGESAKIEQVAGSLRNTRNEVIIAGFTDERGTEEYNRGLGERRAQSLRQVLIEKGVDAGRLQTVSFGEEMPADPGGGESAWARNRRAEFGVVK